MNILFVHCRKGLFSLTICNNCKYKWECENCSANLVTYNQTSYSLNLICHQCQSVYNYPTSCPSCKQTQIRSVFSGIEDLDKLLRDEYKLEPIRLDLPKTKFKFGSVEEGVNSKQVFLTTRLFDPSIDYGVFDTIVLIQADFLLASSDYNIQEELIKSLSDLLLATSNSPKTPKIILETKDPDNEFFGEVSQIKNLEDLINWHKKRLEQEAQYRLVFGFPPDWNMVLLTSHTKKEMDAKNQLQAVKSYLDTIKGDYPEVKVSSPYKAKLLKRKGLFSYHLLIKYPRGYTKFPEFKKEIASLIGTYRLQARINPRTVM
jgi:primosomal protein N' (replication factor Y) (superfamily II helicase)